MNNLIHKKEFKPTYTLRPNTMKQELIGSILEARIKSLFLLLFTIILTQIVEAQTLESYQQEAVKSNPELIAAFNRYLSELKHTPQLGALPDPEIAFSYFISPIETRFGPQNTRVSVSQMFPWFGTLSEKRSISEANAKAQFEQFQEHRNRIFYQMEIIWSDLYEINSNIRIAESNLNIINSLLELSLSSYENGLVSQIDVLRVQIEQEDLSTKIELLKEDREILVQRFNEFRNVKRSEKISIPENLSDLIDTRKRDELETAVKIQNPNLNKLRYREKASQDLISLASRNGKPSFGIGFEYIAIGKRSDVTDFSGNGKDAFIALANFRIPLFRSKYNAKVQQAELNLNSIQQDITALENRLDTDLSSAIRDLYDSKRRYELYDQKQIQRVEQAINIMMDAYSSDASDFEEILRLQRKLLDYQVKRIQANADAFIASSYVRYLTGVNNITINEINY